MEHDAPRRAARGLQVTVRVRSGDPAAGKHRGSAASPWLLRERTIAHLYCGRVEPATSFTFDGLLGSSSTNAHAFDAVGGRLVDAVVNGQNALFAGFGHASSGKTHTMVGTSADPGVIQRVAERLFDVTSANRHRHFHISASYLEVQGDAIQDLLTPGSGCLDMHEDCSRRVFVQSTDRVVTSARQVVDLLLQGNESRSPCSHAILNLIVQSSPRTGNGEGTEPPSRTAVLAIVDLASPERVPPMGVTHAQLRQIAGVKKSLMTFRAIVTQLTASDNAYVPYRESKLTRLLQNVLTPSAVISIMCTVATSEVDVQGTLATLRFAVRLQEIVRNLRSSEGAEGRGPALPEARAQRAMSLVDTCERGSYKRKTPNAIDTDRSQKHSSMSHTPGERCSLSSLEISPSMLSSTSTVKGFGKHLASALQRGSGVPKASEPTRDKEQLDSLVTPGSTVSGTAGSSPVRDDDDEEIRRPTLDIDRNRPEGVVDSCRAQPAVATLGKFQARSVQGALRAALQLRTKPGDQVKEANFVVVKRKITTMLQKMSETKRALARLRGLLNQHSERLAPVAQEVGSGRYSATPTEKRHPMLKYRTRALRAIAVEGGEGGLLRSNGGLVELPRKRQGRERLHSSKPYVEARPGTNTKACQCAKEAVDGAESGASHFCCACSTEKENFEPNRFITGRTR